MSGCGRAPNSSPFASAQAAVFDLGGTVHSIKLTNGETVDMGAFAGRASSIEVSEAFKIEHGKIRRVEMIGGSAP